MEPSPFYTAACRVANDLRAAACSIYEHISTAAAYPGQTRQEPGDKLILLSTSAIGQSLRGQPPDFDTTESKNLHGNAWTGFTSFVARWDRFINVASVNQPLSVDLGRRVLTITRAHLWSEINPLGPLLAAPIRLLNQVAGVIRVVRSDSNHPFNEEDCKRLCGHAELIALLLLEARSARDLIAKIHELKPFDAARGSDTAIEASDVSMPKRDSLLEGIAAAAKELLRAPDRDVAIFMWNAKAHEYTLRAPLEIYAKAKRSGKSRYSLNDNGITPQVWRDYGNAINNRLGGLPPRQILSHDVDKDLDGTSDPPGRFAHTNHVAGDAEKPGQATRSFIAVPILTSNDPKQVEGVIRATSGVLSAFSYSDLMTLRALAEATERLLLQRRAARDRERPLHELMKTIEHGVVVVDRRQTILDLNPAALELLRQGDPRGKSVVEVLFHGREPLARALNDAIASGMQRASAQTPALSGYLTSFFRASEHGFVPIPVRVRASKLADEDSDSEVDTILTFEPLRDYSGVVAVADQGDVIVPGWRTADPHVAREFEKCRGIGPNSSVLILGETGVGKNLLARRVHDMSRRRASKFVAENCAEHRPELVAAELFGTERGAYTGAIARDGRIEPAKGGTVFLDEVAELPLTVQAALLKLIDEKSFKAVGGSEPKNLDVRFVAATNADLEDLVKRGAFRADLYHRLRGTLLRLPPLRNRVDLLLLADDCLQQTWIENAQTEPAGQSSPGDQPDAASKQKFNPHKPWNGQLPAAFDGAVIECFLAHPWAGNFRDLHSIVRTSVEAFHASPSSNDLITVRHLPIDFVEQVSQAQQAQPGFTTRQDHFSAAALYRRVAELEDAVKELRAAARAATADPGDDLTSTQLLVRYLHKNGALKAAFLSTGHARAEAEAEVKRYLKNDQPNGGFADSTIWNAIKAARKQLLKATAVAPAEVASSPTARATNKSTARHRGRAASRR